MALPARQRIGTSLLYMFLCLTASACGLLGCGNGTANQQDRDLAQYNQLEQMLLANRRDFLSSEYSYVSAVQNQLFFLSFPGSTPFLHRYDQSTNTRVDYSFSLGPGNGFNYRASDSLVVTAAAEGAGLTYSAFALNQAQSLLGSTQFPPPSAVDYWPYDVSRGTVYVVTQDQSSTVLNQWTPGGSIVPLFTLESATGERQLGEIGYIEVSGNTMVFIEGGRLWGLDLQAKRATWLMNTTQVDDTVDVEADGVLYNTAQGLFFFDVATQSLRNLSDLIQRNSYSLNSSFPQAHYFVQDFARYGSRVLYGGMAGIFSYDMATNTVAPVLLNPLNATPPSGSPFVYRYPAIVTSGTMYITGLHDNDGPIYSVDLRNVLH